jgi:predicted amino acid-binding ACT domain protein
MGSFTFSLSDELARGNTRENRDRLTRWVGRDPARLSELMQLYLRGEHRDAQLAAGVVTLVADEHPQMMDPWLSAMVKRMQEPDIHNAVVRTGMHVLQVVDIPRRLAGRVAQICFRALEDVSQPIAVRVFAMTVLVNLCQGKKRYTKFHRGKEKIHEGGKDIGVAEPELAREVELAITTVLPYGTAAFTSRAKRELKRLQHLAPHSPLTPRP